MRSFIGMLLALLALPAQAAIISQEVGQDGVDLISISGVMNGAMKSSFGGWPPLQIRPS